MSRAHVPATLLSPSVVDPVVLVGGGLADMVREDGKVRCGSVASLGSSWIAGADVLADLRVRANADRARFVIVETEGLGTNGLAGLVFFQSAGAHWRLEAHYVDRPLVSVTYLPSAGTDRDPPGPRVRHVPTLAGVTDAAEALAAVLVARLAARAP